VLTAACVLLQFSVTQSRVAHTTYASWSGALRCERRTFRLFAKLSSNTGSNPILLVSLLPDSASGLCKTLGPSNSFDTAIVYSLWTMRHPKCDSCAFWLRWSLPRWHRTTCSASGTSSLLARGWACGHRRSSSGNIDCSTPRSAAHRSWQLHDCFREI
jgi:hypothetical protein